MPKGKKQTTHFLFALFFTEVDDFFLAIGGAEVSVSSATGDLNSCLYFENGTSFYDAAYSPSCPDVSVSANAIQAGNDLRIEVSVTYLPVPCQLPAGVDCNDYGLTVFGYADIQLDYTIPTDEDLVVYGDELTNSGNYLLTGNGLQDSVTLDFLGEGVDGTAGIEVTVDQDYMVGSHWKLMLFANGSAAAYDGIDLSEYSTLSFDAKANQDVQVQGAFGTGDDSDVRGMGAISLTSSWKTVTLDISNLNLTDINTFLWLYLHRDLNPGDLTGYKVSLDNVKLIK